MIWWIFLNLISIIYTFQTGLNIHEITATSHTACLKGSGCYLFVNKPLPWNQAAKACQGIRGILTSVEGPAQNEWLVRTLQNFNFQSTFLGAKYTPSLMNYVTASNNSLVKYINNNSPYQVIINKSKVLKRKKRCVHRRRTHHRVKYHRKIHRVHIHRSKKLKWQIKQRQRRRKIYRKNYRVVRRRKIKKFRYKFWIKKFKKKRNEKLYKFRVIRLKRIKKEREEKKEILKKWTLAIKWLKKIKWEIWLKSITGIKVKVWLKRIRTIIEIVNQKSIDKVNVIWLQWWKRIVRWYKEWISKYTKNQATMIWRWKKFVAWLRRVKWQTVLVKVKGIDVSLWRARLGRVIWVIENRKFTEICDKLWNTWRIKVEAWIELVLHEKKGVLKSDKKKVVVMKWSRRIRWLKKYKVMTWIKYSGEFSGWRKEAMNYIKMVLAETKKINVDVLSEKKMEVMWLKIKKSIQTEVGGSKQSPSKEVKEYMKWMNRLNWLKSQNIDYIVKTTTNKELTNYLSKMTNMLKEEKFEMSSTTEIKVVYTKLKVEVVKQETVVRKEIRMIQEARRKRDVEGDRVELNEMMDRLRYVEYGYLRKLLRDVVLRLYFWAHRIESANLETKQELFKRLLEHELERLHQAQVPQEIWELVEKLKLPAIQIVVNKNHCVSIQPLERRTAQQWIQTACNKPQPFVCTMTR